LIPRNSGEKGGQGAERKKAKNKDRFEKNGTRNTTRMLKREKGEEEARGRTRGLSLGEGGRLTGRKEKPTGGRWW